MLNRRGQPVPGLELGLNEQRTKTDADGRFVFNKAPEVYDLIVPGPRITTLYRGLRRRELTVFQERAKARAPSAEPGATFEHEAKLTGSLIDAPPPTNSPDTGHFVQMRFLSEAAQVSVRATGASYGPVSIAWNGPTELTGELVGLALTERPPKAWFARRPVTLKDGSITSADIKLAPVPSLRHPAPVVLFQGQPANTKVNHMREWYESSRWGEVFIRASGAYDMTDTSLIPDPQALGPDFSLCVYAFAANPWLDTVVTRCGYDATQSAELTLPAAPVFTSPAKDSLASPGMHFAWNPTPHALYQLDLGPGVNSKGPRLRIVSATPSADWPDLSSFGIEFPEAPAAYAATVEAFGAHDCIDDLFVPSKPEALGPREKFRTRSQALNLRVHPPMRTEVAECQYSQGAVVVCNDNPDPEQREFYVLSAINAKFRLYPEFADAIGIYCVRDCAGARTFMKAYRAYSEAHPGFESELPIEVEPEPPLPPGVDKPLGAP